MEGAPPAAASVAQVHAARLRDGADVVVKVQRPVITAVVERYLGILRHLARTVEARTGGAGRWLSPGSRRASPRPSAGTGLHHGQPAGDDGSTRRFGYALLIVSVVLVLRVRVAVSGHERG